MRYIKMLCLHLRGKIAQDYYAATWTKQRAKSGQLGVPV